MYGRSNDAYAEFTPPPMHAVTPTNVRVGHEVYLRGGSPGLTVTSVEPDGTIGVAWFVEASGECKREALPAQSLIFAVGEEPAS